MKNTAAENQATTCAKSLRSDRNPSVREPKGRKADRDGESGMARNHRAGGSRRLTHGGSVRYRYPVACNPERQRRVLRTDHGQITPPEARVLARSNSVTATL